MLLILMLLTIMPLNTNTSNATIKNSADSRVAATAYFLRLFACGAYRMTANSYVTANTQRPTNRRQKKKKVS